MQPTIIPGDYVLVNKLAYGARIFDLFDAVDGKDVKIRRAPGFTDVKNNDVVVFHIPHPNSWDKIEMNMSKYFIKRYIGIPGDTLRIINGIYRTFPWDLELNWNIKDFGPLYIPKKGDKIILNRANALLYKKIKEWEKGHSLQFERDSLWENKTYLPAYTFRHNYYFMGGDKVVNSQDSRYWGLLPDELIVGKAWLIWKSIDPYSKKIRQERILKKIE